MRLAVTITLFPEETRGVLEERQSIGREVFAEVKSVGMHEFFAAQGAGIEPEIKFVLSDFSEYNGERVVEYNNTRYRVIRTFVSDYKVELTCGRETVK